MSDIEITCPQVEQSTPKQEIISILNKTNESKEETNYNNQLVWAAEGSYDQIEE